jgi:hypothetical protein
MGNRRDVYRVLVGKSEVTRPSGTTWCRLEDNIKVDIQKVWKSGCGQSYLAERTRNGLL